jgi:hypothetical protein
MNSRLQLAALLGALSLACASVEERGPHLAPVTAPLAELASWMTGSFSSEAQAAADPDGYFDIRLFMQPVWEERTDGPWLYVEQAAASALERPYRQRMYRLVEGEDGLRVDIYELPGDPLRFAGAWREAALLDGVAVEDLAPRSGCSVYLRRSGAGYEGSTLGEGCSSSLRGASYTTSFVTLTETSLTSWDRGFDASGEQVWGATEGPYRFLRVTP